MFGQMVGLFREKKEQLFCHLLCRVHSKIEALSDILYFPSPDWVCWPRWLPGPRHPPGRRDPELQQLQHPLGPPYHPICGTAAGLQALRLSKFSECLIIIGSSSKANHFKILCNLESVWIQPLFFNVFHKWFLVVLINKCILLYVPKKTTIVMYFCRFAPCVLTFV